MNPMILYAHGGSLNHGCEAIVRSTAKILDKSSSLMTLLSLSPQEDVRVGLDQIINVADHSYHAPLSRSQMLMASISHKLTGTDDRFYRYKHASILKVVTSDSIALSIGGDNYCYGDCSWLYTANAMIRERGARTVLWGCSVEPSTMDAEMINDLNGYDVITPRESITYHAMLDKGVKAKTVLFPDPAFQLDKVLLPLPSGFEEGNTIGLNISPLIVKSEGRKGATMQAAMALIQHILKTTESSIALIPHVTWPANNDLEPLTELFALFKDSGRVILLGDHNCMELKGFISRCRMFIGARTHSTIAAYSTQVPTLVIGYSVKARGIARDIFGSERDLVLPVQELTASEQLIEAFEKLREREEDLRRQLAEIIPEYVGRAAQAEQVIAPLS